MPAVPVLRAHAARLLTAAAVRAVSRTKLGVPHPDAAGLHAERRGFTFVYRHPAFAAHTARCVEHLGEHEAAVSEDLSETYPTGAYQGYRGGTPLGAPETPVRQAPEPPDGPLVSLREAVDARLLTCTLEAAKTARKRRAHGFPRHVSSRPAPGHPVKLYRQADLAAWEARRRG